jgi:hypothetical protein
MGFRVHFSSESVRTRKYGSSGTANKQIPSYYRIPIISALQDGQFMMPLPIKLPETRSKQKN